MAVWQDFELDCTDYLNDVFGTYAHFEHQGGSDSTVADIKVKTRSGRLFYIDAKHCPAQCGQFVLLPDVSSRTFIYSDLNVNRINEYAIMIMDYMNEYFDEFREAGTAGKDIDMKNGPQIFSNWIAQIYKEKGAEYFITNDYRIIHIEDIIQYFNISAKYRIKRSGSGNVGSSRISLIANVIKSMDCGVVNFRNDGEKLFVKSDYELHNKRFVYGGYEYMFSKRGSEYEIRKLSNTYNANVIFSIDLKSNKNGISEEEFINRLK